MYELMVEKTFSAAHFLENYDGPCANLHGHTYRVQFFVAGSELDDVGMLEDYTNLKADLESIVQIFDHQLINDLVDYNPTSELIAKDFYHRLKPKYSGRVKILKIVLWESATSYSAYSE